LCKFLSKDHPFLPNSQMSQVKWMLKLCYFSIYIKKCSSWFALYAFFVQPRGSMILKQVISYEIWKKFLEGGSYFFFSLFYYTINHYPINKIVFKVTTLFFFNTHTMWMLFCIYKYFYQYIQILISIFSCVMIFSLSSMRGGGGVWGLSAHYRHNQLKPNLSFTILLDQTHLF